jgi:hypothetical protein
MSDSIHGSGRHLARATHLLALDAQLDLGDVRPEEQRHRPTGISN